MFFHRDPKLQDDVVPVPEGIPADVIISPDTRRTVRVPPGQSRTKKWPVLDASGTPSFSIESWTLTVDGLVEQPISLTLDELKAFPQVRVFSDFHCLTRWSRLGNIWDGVSTREIISRCGGLKSEARFVLAHGLDHGWTTNLPLSDFLMEDALLAMTHDGESLSSEHGGPVRLIIPRLYAWKSAKWLTRIEFIASDRAGFWERNGYHMRGDPWNEERYGW